MKIVYLIDGMFNSAGMERVVANKANYFAQHGHQVTIVTTDQKGRKDYYELNKTIQRIDLQLNFGDYAQLPILLRIPAYWWKSISFRCKLSKILKQIKPDITDSLILRSADFLHKITDGSRKIMEHHFTYNYFEAFTKAFDRGRLAAFIYQQRAKMVEKKMAQFDKFVVLTEEDAKNWRKTLPNVEVIPNSLSFSPEKRTQTGRKVVLAVGRLEYQKGFDILLKIWEKVSPQNPQWQLHIYGNGPDKEHLQTFAKQHNIENSVQFFPATKEIQNIFYTSSIYVMTSRFEGFPMVLLEALACGLPTVAFACKCGPNDIISNNSDGFVVEMGNEATFAEKLEQLMNDPNLREKMSLAAQKNSVRFAEENVMKLWEKLFKMQ